MNPATRARAKASLTKSHDVPSAAMDSSTISGELASIFREDLQIDVSRFTADSHLIDEVGLDSVAFAVGMVAIEEKLGVVLSEEELLTCNTLGDLDSAIRDKGAAAPATSSEAQG
ncbi:acyl carrier protein [Mycolicibacterium sp. Dal123E01]|uniref:acyl carrier protein n=1 Tax=Mycolicibacterium sp. Dal123E01 TaxID=3457578 RepID=UPI00403EEBC1